MMPSVDIPTFTESVKGVPLSITNLDYNASLNEITYDDGSKHQHRPYP